MDKDPFLNEVGRTVVDLAEHIPQGVLVFLPSYSLLRRAVDVWGRSGVSDDVFPCVRGLCDRWVAACVSNIFIPIYYIYKCNCCGLL